MPSKKEVLDKFMQEFESGTAPHQKTRHLRLWEHKAEFEVGVAGSSVRLGYIGSIHVGRGHGTRALRWLLNLADKHGVEVRGSIHRVGREGLSERELKLWYRRHGFEIEQKKIVYHGKQDVE